MITSRRSLLVGFASLLAAPAIVRASSIMPVKVWSVGDGVALNSMPHPEFVDVWDHTAAVDRNLGLALLKVEGRTTLFDPMYNSIVQPTTNRYMVAPGDRLFIGDILVLGTDGYAHRADHLVTDPVNILGVAAKNSWHPFDN